MIIPKKSARKKRLRFAVALRTWTFSPKSLSEITDERSARILRFGLRVALCGSPNTGKSTLFNALLSEERAIVTDIPGTTRDVLEGSFSLQGFQVNLMDTAGLRAKARTPSRIIGVQRAKQVLDTADVALARD